MKVKEKKGITLIVLVVTIVVMIILIGTVIVSISGYGELKNLKALAIDLQTLQEKINIYYEKNDELPVDVVISDDGGTFFGSTKNANDGDVYYKIDLGLLDNIKLTYGNERFEKDYYIVNEASHNVYYYAGFKLNGVMYYGIRDVGNVISDIDFGVQNFELKTNVNAITSGGIANIQLEVYSDLMGYKYKFRLNDGDWTAEQMSNTYIFTNLKRFETYKVSMIIIDGDNNEIYASNNGMEITIGELPVNATIDGKTSGTYNNPIIPAGFIPLNENGANWKSSDGFKKGLVITDKVDDNGVSVGNEFVWVPVDGTNVKFERTEFNTGAVSLVDCTETVPTNITDSVNANGGFYIARYEAGNASNVLVSQKGKIVYTNVTLSDAQSKATAMYSASNEAFGAISTLIYGTQWDAVLDFISSYNVGESGYSTYVMNSTGMGNYAGTNGGDMSTATPAVCGALEAFKQKNIYDMAGNVGEWTMELIGTGENVVRGGSYVDDGLVYPASTRYNSSSNIGFRVALYIES